MRTTRSQWLRPIAMVGALSLLLAACGGSDEDPNAPQAADDGEAAEDGEEDPEDTVEEPDVDEPRKTEDGWPEQAISITEPFGAGGLLDLSSRYMGAVVGPMMGVQAVNLNQPGGANEVAAQSVLGQPRDGQHIFATLIDSYNFMAAVLSEDTNPEDFVPLGAHGDLTGALIVSNDAPWETLEEFIAAAEAGDEINMAVTLASGNHAQTLVFKEAYGADGVNIVPFGGGSDQRTAVAGGTVQAMFTPVGGYPAIQDQTRLLAVVAEENLDTDPAIEGAPVWGDISDVEMQYVSQPMIWMVPAEVETEYPERLELLREVYAEAAQSDEYKDAMDATGALGSVVYMTPEEVDEITKEYLELAERFRAEFTQ